MIATVTWVARRIDLRKGLVALHHHEPIHFVLIAHHLGEPGHLRPWILTYRQAIGFLVGLAVGLLEIIAVALGVLLSGVGIIQEASEGDQGRLQDAFHLGEMSDRDLQYEDDQGHRMEIVMCDPREAEGPDLHL